MNIRRFTFIQLTAGLVFSLSSISITAQSLAEVIAEECVLGDCLEGRGRMELSTQWGKGEYFGNFTDGEFHGKGRLEIRMGLGIILNMVL